MAIKRDTVGFWVFIALVLTLVGISDVFAKRVLIEDVHNELFCMEMGGTSEARNSDGTRTDCLTTEYAIEADFADKWYEGVGQAVHYARLRQRLPGLFLIVEERKQCKYLYRALQSISLVKVLLPSGRYVGIRVWVSGEEVCHELKVDKPL